MSALEELALRCGIAETLTDAFGKEHTTPPVTKRALLHAMRIDASSDEAAQRSLDSLIAEEWAASIPPVLVAYPNRPIELPLNLPVDTGTVTWKIALEDGTALCGQARFIDLPLEASRQGSLAMLQRRLLTIQGQIPHGYHTLQITEAGSACTLIVTPGTCWLPSMEDDGKVFGFAAQLYLLRSKNDWGIGDFADLRTFSAMSRENGADVVGVNPLHAMFPDQPEQASPYSPSDRLLLNLLYISVDNIPEFADCSEAQALLANESFRAEVQYCRDASHVQYAKVTELKMRVLRLLFAHFQREARTVRLAELRAFHEERRDLLDRSCTFQALREFFADSGATEAQPVEWPEDYGSYSSPAVSRFREEHAHRIRFHLWAQWIADSQLKLAADECRGMTVGLYRDLAVGSAPFGAEVWSYPEAFADASVGAPPDIWNPAGQNWGLPPIHPLAVRKAAYGGFIELIRTNMRHAGALRIDHALALQRLYWIPEGASAKDGAYVAYSIQDLLGILALESHRNRCMVIGEDLGTVPEGFRERASLGNVLSYRLLFFERDEAGFFHPDRYPKLSLSMASSHDLPTLLGWWNEIDLEAKERLNLFPREESARSARSQRTDDQIAMLALFHKLLLTESPDVEPSDVEFVSLAHSLLAQTNSMMTLFQLDDVTHERDQVNIPGTTTETPNWRRRLSQTLEEVEWEVP
jgi:glycogen operon protein